MFKISVIIPVYNRSDELVMTLDTLLAQTLGKKDFEVVIADDGSKDDIQSVLKKYPELNTVYCSQEDLGFRVAAVRNLGMKNASGEIIVFNDNGILLTQNALQKHIEYHEKADNLVLLGNIMGFEWTADMNVVRELLDDNTVLEAINIMKETGGMGDGREGYMKRFGDDVSKWYIPWLALWGGHFSFKKDFASENNICFDENFTSWGGEDNDFGIQLCTAGGKYIFARDIEVAHYPTKGRENNDISSEDFRKHYAEVKTYIANKHCIEETNVWLHLGSSSNDDEKRAEFLKNNI